MRSRALAGLGAMLALATVTTRAQDFATAFRAAEEARTKGTDAAALRAAYGRAASAFLQLPAGSPERARTLAQGAAAAWRAGDARWSQALYEEAWSDLPHTSDLASERMRAQLDAGAAEAAIVFAHAIRAEFATAGLTVLSGDRRGGDPRVLAAADHMLKTGRTELGLWAFQVCAEGSPGVAIAIGNHALACRHVGQVAEAERLYLRALELAPDDALLCNDYGLFLKGVGRHEEAVKAFLRGRELERPPGSSPAIPNLRQLEGVLGRKLLLDPRQDMATVLALRPDAAFPRRLAIDFLLEADAVRRARGR